MKEFEMTDGGELNFFLVYLTERNDFSLKIDQIQYLTNLLKKFNMNDCFLYQLQWNIS